MSNVDFLQQVINTDGLVAASVLAKVLHITQTDLAEVTGLSIDSVSKSARLKSRATQARLRDTVEIINRVAEWSGGAGRAFAWFRSQPFLPLQSPALKFRAEYRDYSKVPDALPRSAP